MSFDLYAEAAACPHCGEGEHLEPVWIANVTHNVNPMVERVFEGTGIEIKGADPSWGYIERSWGRFHGHALAEVAPLALRMLEWFRDHETELVPLNPQNGWGSTKCVERVLNAIIAAAAEWPRRRLRVSG